MNGAITPIAGKQRGKALRGVCRRLEAVRRAAQSSDDTRELLNVLTRDTSPCDLFDVTITDGKMTRRKAGASFIFARTAYELGQRYGIQVPVEPHRERAHLTVVK